MTPIFRASTAGMVVYSKEIQHWKSDENHGFSFGHVEDLFRLFVLFSVEAWSSENSELDSPPGISAWHLAAYPIALPFPLTLSQNLILLQHQVAIWPRGSWASFQAQT